VALGWSDHVNDVHRDVGFAAVGEVCVSFDHVPADRQFGEPCFPPERGERDGLPIAAINGRSDGLKRAVAAYAGDSTDAWTTTPLAGEAPGESGPSTLTSAAAGGYGASAAQIAASTASGAFAWPRVVLGRP
jgi:hypothetical protein